jgi:uncharacterized membrane-anchored protein
MPLTVLAIYWKPKTNNMKILCLAFILIVSSLSSSAGDPGDSTKILLDELRKIDSIESSLQYKTGKVVLGNGMAVVNVAPGFKFLDAKDAKYVLEDLWGNLKGQNPLGMIIPENMSATFADYAFIIEFDEMGYVKDGDADKINYDDLLKSIKEEQVDANNERRKLGMQEMNIIGWAAKPHYDSEKKLLYWAKEFKVGSDEENTLNYDIRILGRKGVLVLQAVSSMNQFDSVDKNIDNILGMVSFADGHQYKDFDSNIDEVAAWTIGGLVAGKVLAKAGIIALVLKNIKLVLFGLAAVGGGIWKFVTGRRRKEEELPVYESQKPEPEQV